MAEKFGRPQVIISFKTKSTTAITRSGRGVGCMILNDEHATDKVVMYTITDETEIPSSGLSDKSVDLILTALLILRRETFVSSIPITQTRSLRLKVLPKPFPQTFRII